MQIKNVLKLCMYNWQISNTYAGFITGSSDPDVYGPDLLVADDVVVVTFNYRWD